MLILIEGVDGSGKNTQAKLLVERINEYKKDTASLLSFPQYEESFFGREVANYLNGDYGTLTSMNPKFPSLLYSLDRYEAKNQLLFASCTNHIAVLDRYTQSNIAHQCAKLEDDNEKFKLQGWIEHVEFSILGLPRPDIIFFLDLPVSFTEQLVLKKDNRNYTDKKKDLHEADLDYMARSRAQYIRLADEEDWKVINCLDKEKNMLSIEEIHNKIVTHLQNDEKFLSLY
jgi:dTMP kinase